MLDEEEEKAIERLKERVDDNEDYKTVQVWLTYDVVAVNTVLKLITKQQKENEEKDKIIYEVAKSNVKLKGYEVEEKYIDTTIRFFTKYVKNLERNPQWRNDKNE